MDSREIREQLFDLCGGVNQTIEWENGFIQAVYPEYVPEALLPVVKKVFDNEDLTENELLEYYAFLLSSYKEETEHHNLYDREDG